MNQFNSFSVLPLDVWDILLNKYITDSKSWLSCMYSSNLFRKDEITFKWKQNIVSRLLPEILTILQTKGTESYLNDDDIKNLRLVSKHWHRAVDKFTIDSPLNNRHVCGPTPRIWLSEHNVDKILAHFESASSELQLVKSFHIAENLEYEDLQKVTKILEITGPKLRGLSWCTGTYMKYRILCGSTWYTTLRYWLNLVPNLESLQLSVVLFEDFENLQIKFKAFTNELKIPLKVYPVPKLEKLSILKFDEYVPVALLKKFLHQNPNVHVVHIGNGYVLY